MKFPSKVTSFNDSIIAKFPLVLNELEKCEQGPHDLYNKIKRKLTGLTEFVEIMVCLFALNKIELIEGDIFRYVKKH